MRRGEWRGGGDTGYKKSHSLLPIVNSDSDSSLLMM